MRGEVPATGVADLRKQLRSLERSGKSLVTPINDAVYAEKDFEECQVKADELLAQVNDLGQTPDLGSTAVSRLRLRQEHLVRRLDSG